MKRKLNVKSQNHRSPHTIRPELKRDIAWFNRHPFATERTRAPSKRERREWGPLVTLVVVFRLNHGEFATVPFETDADKAFQVYS